MSIARRSTGNDDLATLFRLGAAGSLTDEELLARFTAKNDRGRSEAAFAALVARHGRLVQGVCRRILGCAHGADDAFQATFLILARKAHSVHVDDSLGRWLHGVSMRVAWRARAIARAHHRHTQPLGRIDPPAASEILETIEHEELRLVIDQEIERLPARYRSVIVLCCLEGLSDDVAARRLKCPIGTVHSRLNRARARLRDQLLRRGLAPAVGATTALSAAITCREAVARRLISSTAAAAVRVAAHEATIGIVPAAAVTLANSAHRSTLMVRGICVAASAILVLGFAAHGSGAGGWQEQGAQPKTDRSTRDKSKSSSHDLPSRPAPLEDRYRALEKEYESKNGTYLREYQKLTAKATSYDDRTKVAYELKDLAPDNLAYAKRFLELAREKPDDLIAGDAAYYVHQIIPKVAQLQLIDKSRDGKALWAEYWRPYVESLTLLREHHVRSPKMGEYLQQIALCASPEAEALFREVLAKNPSRLARGHALQGLARALEDKSLTAQSFVEHSEKVKESEVKNGDRIIRWVTGQDPAALMLEAESLHERVLKEYSDVRTFPTYPDDKQTIDRTSQYWLANHRQLIVGAPAPEIDGVDINGKRFKLSDFRGKVVALVFWASWCGPCLQEIPHEQELAKRLEGKPFALLGVNCDSDREKASAVLEKEKITWPNWFDGAQYRKGAIAAGYHVQAIPIFYIIDREGIIRFKDVRGEALDRAVDETLKSTGSKTPEPPSAR
jgi:RNA polymerase sigma factor (sigma-70 family)